MASKPTLESILDRRKHGGIVSRDLTDGTVSGDGDDGEKPFTSPTAWLLGILASLALVAGAVLAVVAVPPTFECRHRAEQGFFVGQTYGGCVSAGISARWTLLGERVKMTLLHSGR